MALTGYLLAMEPSPEIILMANAWEARRWLIESAGLFWLYAEIAIAGFILYCRCHLLRAHGGNARIRIALAPGFVLAAIGISALTMLTRSRSAGTFKLLEKLRDSTPEALLAARTAELESHLLVWSTFVVFWVLLEALIVYQGWRLYRQLIPHVQD